MTPGRSAPRAGSGAPDRVRRQNRNRTGGHRKRWFPTVLLVVVSGIGCGRTIAGGLESRAPLLPSGPLVRGTLLSAVDNSLQGLGRVEDDRTVLLKALGNALREGLSTERAIARTTSIDRTDEVLLTGYYEPVLSARRRPGGPFRHPLHAVPREEAQRGASRREIDGGALEGRGLELFWLDDPIAKFFLQIQGSGRLDLGESSLVRIGYAGSNGRPYHSIGAELVRRGALSLAEASAPGIERWLRAHPEEVREILHSNPRYIFFRELELAGTDGPIGALGVPLVAGHSVATDPAGAPAGSVGLLRARWPDGSLLQTVVVAMDEGAAIQGNGRLDLFLGAGAEAGSIAGRLRSAGSISWLRLRRERWRPPRPWLRRG